MIAERREPELSKQIARGLMQVDSTLGALYADLKAQEKR